MTTPRKPRGKGTKPKMTYRAIRLPQEILDYYTQNFPNPSLKMREVLTAYRDFKESAEWASSLAQRDSE